MSDTTTTLHFDGWGIFEAMGHVKRAGKVRTEAIGGTAVFVVETPDGTEEDGTERFLAEIYAASSLYRLTPCTEEVARIAARSVTPAPVSRYDFPPAVRRAIEQAEREKYERERAIEAGGHAADEDPGPIDDRDDGRREDDAAGHPGDGRGR